MTVSPSRTRWPALGLFTAALVFAIDRVAKYILIERVMRPDGVTDTPFFSDRLIHVLPVFNLRMAWNYGISFSLFNSGSHATIVALIGVEALITLALIWFLWQQTTRWMQVAVGLLVGGAMGTIFDRLAYGGAVADFFDFHLADWHFATFNVSDSFITVGVALWLLDAIRSGSHHAPAPQGQQKD